MVPEITITRPTREHLSILVDLFKGQRGSEILDFLDQEISRARVVEPEEIDSRVATPNSRLRYRDNGTGTTEEVILAYASSDETVPRSLSILSPAGCCLLGLAEGQSMQWIDAEGRIADVTLLEVISQPEASEQGSG